MKDEQPKTATFQGSEIPLYRVVNVDVTKHIPSEYNPNTAGEKEIEALRKSIKQNPKWLMVRPVVLNMYPGREFRIVAGEQRWTAAKLEGHTTIPSVFVYDDPIQEKADNERDNIRAGKVDPAKEQELLKELRDSGYDMTSIGYTPEVMADMMNFGDTAQTTGDMKTDPEYNGTTPSKELKCPECGHVGKKRDFKIKEEKQS